MKEFGVDSFPLSLNKWQKKKKQKNPKQTTKKVVSEVLSRQRKGHGQ